MASDVLGRVLEVVSGLPLDRLFRQKVFHPMGMKDTAFCVSPKKAQKRLTAYYVTKVRVKHRGEPEMVVIGLCSSSVHPCS